MLIHLITKTNLIKRTKVYVNNNLHYIKISYTILFAGPITTDIIYTLNRSTGAILKQWGKNLFYLPHGLTVDRLNNAFVTDVAMHQVFKFNLNISSEQPSLTLGEAFVPGSKIGQFCKPTAVAVLPDGKFFVADGYCNARIIQYTESGIYYKHVSIAF